MSNDTNTTASESVNESATIFAEIEKTMPEENVLDITKDDAKSSAWVSRVAFEIEGDEENVFHTALRANGRGPAEGALAAAKHVVAEGGKNVAVRAFSVTTKGETRIHDYVFNPTRGRLDPMKTREKAAGRTAKVENVTLPGETSTEEASTEETTTEQETTEQETTSEEARPAIGDPGIEPRATNPEGIGDYVIPEKCQLTTCQVKSMGFSDAKLNAFMIYGATGSHAQTATQMGVVEKTVKKHLRDVARALTVDEGKLREMAMEIDWDFVWEGAPEA